MRTTASPCSARRWTRSSTWRVCATPSAAVGSSRITMREFHITARPIATDWRWPPERLATCWRIELDRRDREALQHVRRSGLHHRFPEPEEEVAHLAAEVHVLDDVEVVAEREILVHDLDPELAASFGPGDRDLLALEVDLALVDRVDPGDALDQRRLAGAVVADERHHLARAHLEVDVGRARGPSRSSCGRLAPRASASTEAVAVGVVSVGRGHPVWRCRGSPAAGLPRRSASATSRTACTSRRRRRDFLRCPSLKSRLKLAFVIQTGGMMNDGSVLRAVVHRPGLTSAPPFNSATAAAADARGDRSCAALCTVLDCQPEMTFCTPCAVASWPGQRDRLQLLRLERGHDRVREAVVGRGDARRSCCPS